MSGWLWDRLLARCGLGDLLVSGQRVTDHVKDVDVDVVLALADGGIVIVEVKGGEVTHGGASWRQRHGPIHPVEQVRDVRYGCATRWSPTLVGYGARRWCAPWAGRSWRVGWGAEACVRVAPAGRVARRGVPPGGGQGGSVSGSFSR